MKKISLLLFTLTICFFTACHNDIWDAIDELDGRVTKLEELCKEMNTNITSLQTIVDVLQSNDFITNIVEIKKDGKVVGYTITFGKHDPITIYHGQDGKDGQNGQNGQNGADGKDGSTPVIGVAQDADGVYYWTLNGEWLLDDNGNKLPVSGKDGKDGANGADGKDGQDGADGKDGISPLLKIENGYWYISYDNGATWTELGKAIGEDGKDGADGKDGQNGADGKDGQDGDSMFQSVTQDENYVYFTLADGTVIKIAKGSGENDLPNGEDYIDFKDLVVKSLLIEQYDSNGDGEISYNEAVTISGRLKLYMGVNSTIDFHSFKEFKYFTNVTSCDIGANSLFEIEFPERLDSIVRCNGKIKTVELPKGCKYIGSKALCTYNNGSPSTGSVVKNIIWNDSIEYIGVRAFGTTAYNYASLPNSIKIIDRDESGSPGIRISAKEFAFPYDFQGKPGGVDLQNVETIYWNTNQFTTSYSWTRGTSLTHYGLSDYGPKEAYSSPDTTIKKVVFGSAVKNIPAYLCYYLWGLTEVDIPDNVENIESCSFQGCGYLQKITIGKGVSTIGYKAFDFGYYVSNPKIYCKATTPPIIDGDVFYSSIIIYVPRASVEEYRTLWSNYANKIVGYDFE